MNRSNKYLIIKGKAGMGNRILSALDGIVYSKLTQRRIVIDWSDYAYSHDGSNVFPKYFSLANSFQLSDIPLTVSIYPAVWKNNLELSINELIDACETSSKRHSRLGVLSKYTTDINKLDYAEAVLVRSAFSGEIWKMQRFLPLIADYHNLSPDSIYQKLLQEELRLNPNLAREVNSFSSQYFAPETIGVHIRYTDRKTDLNKYPQAIKKFLDRAPQANIFLATDNEKIATEFKQTYGANKVLTTNKWYPEKSQYLHQNSSCPDRFLSGKQALIDMYLLAKCNYLVYDGASTFALIAAFLGNRDRQIDISQSNFKRKLKTILARVS